MKKNNFFSINMKYKFIKLRTEEGENTTALASVKMTSDRQLQSDKLCRH